MPRIKSALLLAVATLLNLIWGESNFDYNFHQNDYHLTPERADVISYNKEYIKHYSIITFKYNRSTTAINSSMQFKIDVGYDLELVTQLYKFASNEYRLFPLRLQLNFCKAVTSDIAGAKTGFLKCGNFSKCPIVKNNLYHLCRFTIDEAKLPPFIPNGRYMAEIQGMYFTSEMFVIRAYAEISRPISWQ